MIENLKERYMIKNLKERYMIVNLWEEVNETLQRNGKTWEDVESIYGEKYQITKENFKNIAIVTDYYRISDTVEIAWDLRIRGKDFIMHIDHINCVIMWKLRFFEKNPPKEIKEIFCLQGKKKIKKIFCLQGQEGFITLDEMNTNVVEKILMGDDIKFI